MASCFSDGLSGTGQRSPRSKRRRFSKLPPTVSASFCTWLCQPNVAAPGALCLCHFMEHSKCPPTTACTSLFLELLNERQQFPEAKLSPWVPGHLVLGSDAPRENEQGTKQRPFTIVSSRVLAQLAGCQGAAAKSAGAEAGGWGDTCLIDEALCRQSASRGCKVSSGVLRSQF